MPRKPRKMCSYPGCPELTYSRYCVEHNNLRMKEYNSNQRDKACSKRYTGEWLTIRKNYIAEHPYCEECLKWGKFKDVEHVHHIKPLSEGGSNEANNLKSLCLYHHNQLHAKDGSRFKRKKPVVYECKEYRKFD